MARQVQLRRGTTTQHSTFTGAVGEVTVDTTKDTVVVHDGSTAGGVPLLKAADLAAGTGIDVTGTTITNTSPDQTVVLTSGTGISATGTYPNFTITNTAPDQTVVLTEGSNVTITGTYPNFTIASTDTNTTYTAGTGLVLAGTEFSVGTTVVTSTYTGDVDITGELIVDSYNETFVSLSGATPTVDCEAGNVFALTTSDNTTFTFSNPPTSGTAYGFTLKVTAGGTHTLTWPASVDWAGGTAPDAPASGETDVFAFFTHDGGTTWYGFQAGDALT